MLAPLRKLIEYSLQMTLSLKISIIITVLFMAFTGLRYSTIRLNIFF